MIGKLSRSDKVLAAELVLIAFLAPLVIVALVWRSEAATGLKDRHQNAERASSLRGKIQELRAETASVEKVESNQAIDATEIAAVAEQIGIRSQQIGSIRRRVETRLKDTQYRRLEISIELDRVTLKELLQFCQAIDGRPGIGVISSLDINSPRLTRTQPVSLSAETWFAEMTLTRLRFAATSGM